MNPEIFGTIAGVLMLTSFLMPRQLLIRIIGLVACAFFLVYGVLLSAYSLWILNSVMVLINIFYIVKILVFDKRKKDAKKD